MSETYIYEGAGRMKANHADKTDHRSDPLKSGVSSPWFDDLFVEHWAHVYRALLNLVGDPAEAEDLALEAFFRLYQHPQVVKEGSNLGGWLHRVAVNLGLHSIRSYHRRTGYELAAGKNALEEADENRPAEIQAREEEHDLTRMALAQMNPRRAQLLILRYSGMSYKELSVALNISSTSIGPLLLRAEREFEKQYLALSEGTHSEQRPSEQSFFQERRK
jgi:RNA polymerase sigma factor (sigma-70 family)